MLRGAVIALWLLGSPALAQTPQDAILSQLQAQGYTTISANRTFLGRVRIVAESEAYRREIVFNPDTGEILRDYWVALDGSGGVGELFNPGGHDGADSDNDNDDDNADDDDADDDRDDDDDDNDDDDRDNDDDNDDDGDDDE